MPHAANFTNSGKCTRETIEGGGFAGLVRANLDNPTRPDQVENVKIVNVQEAKTHLSRLIDQAASGEIILIGKYGKPLAKLTAYAPQSEQRPLGGLEDQISISADFDEEDIRIQTLFLGATE